MLKRITLTGIDNKTNIDDLKRLQEKYSFVEFGVLVSEKLSNTNQNNRYPHLTILKRLKNQGLNLSCHLCGKVARNIVTLNDWEIFEKLLGKDVNIFDRFQLNVSDCHRFINTVSFPEDKTFIIQFKQDTNLFETYKDLPNIIGFQDNSGGRGIFDNNWEKGSGFFGYAGGLNAENLKDVLTDLYLLNDNDTDFWVDMESSLRTDDWFDIAKCEKILKIASEVINLF